MRPIIFFDLETTGTDVMTDRIVEMSFIKILEDGTRKEASTRIKPLIPIPAGATAVHGISDADVANAPKFKDVAKKLLKFLIGCDIAGFNSNRFDVPLLYTEFLRVKLKWDLNGINLIDVGNLFKIQEPRTLEAAYRYYLGKDIAAAHTADADTQATIEVFEAMKAKYDNIPTSREELSIYTNYGRKRLGISGHFAYNEEEQIILNFGKHKEELAIDNREYLIWMLNAEFPYDTREIIEKILK